MLKAKTCLIACIIIFLVVCLSGCLEENTPKSTDQKVNVEQQSTQQNTAPKKAITPAPKPEPIISLNMTELREFCKKNASKGDLDGELGAQGWKYPSPLQGKEAIITIPITAFQDHSQGGWGLHDDLGFAQTTLDRNSEKYAKVTIYFDSAEKDTKYGKTILYNPSKYLDKSLVIKGAIEDVRYKMLTGIEPELRLTSCRVIKVL